MGYLEACNNYLDHAERAFATKTFKNKKAVYKNFYGFLKHDVPIKEISTQVIQNYLMTRPSNVNFNIHKKEISALFTFIKDILNAVDFNPVLKIKNLPHNRKDRIIPSEECIIKLMLAADPKTDERALLMVLLHTLARIDEVLRLTWADINFEKRILVKKTKKTRDRAYKDIPVSINDDLYETLWKLWQNRTQDTWVFFNKKTNTRYYSRPRFMRGLCKRARIAPYFTFHNLRHMMASLMDDNPKISLTTIQKILGHTAIRTTELYLHKSNVAHEEAMSSISGKFKLKGTK